MGFLGYNSDEKKYKFTESQIADLRENARKLDERSRMMEIFIAHCPAPIVMLDKDMKTILFSLHWSDFFGPYRQSDVGKHIREIHKDIGVSTPSTWPPSCERAMQESVSIVQRQPWQRGDVSRWMEYTTKPWYLGSEIGGVFILAHDVTEVVEQELNLRTSLTSEPYAESSFPALEVAEGK